MNEKYKTTLSIMSNLSGVLIPISLASITFISTNSLPQLAKVLLTLTIPLQNLSLIISLWISLHTIANVQSEIALKKDINYAKLFFFSGLILIFISHAIVLLSNNL